MEKWRDSHPTRLDAKGRAHFSQLIGSPSEKLQLIKGPNPDDVRSKRAGKTRKAQQHLGQGGKKLRQRKSSSSRPGAGRRSCPCPAGAPRRPRPSAHAARHGPRPFKLPPKCNYYARPVDPAPIPTKFREKLPSRARPVPDNRWAAAPAGPGLSLARPTPLLPGRGPGAPGSGTGRGARSLTSAIFAVLTGHISAVAAAGSRPEPGCETRQRDSRRRGRLPAPAATASAGTRRSRPSAPTTPHSAPSRRPRGAGLEGKAGASERGRRD